MANKADAIRNHLPSLYRPEPADPGTLPDFIRAVGEILDGVDLDLTAVMQAHWFPYADAARFDPYFLSRRAAQGMGPPDPAVPEDRLAVATFPYLHDLARIGALLHLPPWREPPDLRETVEAYRSRLARFVALYRNGLGTVRALRAAVEATLPPDPAQPPEAVDRSFSVEEFAPVAGAFRQARSLGPPTDRLGPLMRWRWTNHGMTGARPTVIIRGEADSGAERPMIERFRAAPDWQGGVGIGWTGTLGKGQALRLRPAFGSWLGRADGLHGALSAPDEDGAPDPTAAGPWTPVAGPPAGPVTALCQTEDGVLWISVKDGGEPQLWRYDGAAWTRVLEGTVLAAIHALQGRRGTLFIGTADGLRAMDLYPEEGTPFSADSVPPFSGAAVHALMADGDDLLAGTDNGAFRWSDSVGLTPLAVQGTPVRALARDRDGVLYFGGERGVFQYQPGLDHLYAYRGRGAADETADWKALAPGELPEPADVFLPPVRGLAVGPDSALWIGTDRGFARYIARPAEGLTYTTLLEAFPDLVDGPVHGVTVDPRGRVLLGTDRGLFRFDGRDLAQYIGADQRWVPRGKAARLYPPDGPPEDRGAWRFNRALSGGRWQRAGAGGGDWTLFEPTLRSSDEPAVRCLAWTDGVVADLGTWAPGDEVFTPSAPVDPSELVLRVKPTEDRIVAGGIPALPRMPVGPSDWRYLSLEPPGVTPPTDGPAWSPEGRLMVSPSEVVAPYPGRFRNPPPEKRPESAFDRVVFAYPPAASVWFQWHVRQPYSVIVRLQRRHAEESIHPAILDRVRGAVDRVRPAGVQVLLAVDNDTV